MQFRRLRPTGRKWVGVCLAMGFTVIPGWFAARDSRAETKAKVEQIPKRSRPQPVWLPENDSEPAVLVFAPKQSAEKKPMAVMLHGMCDPPERECPYFANTVTEFAWLICPRARLRCPGGGTMWEWRKKHQTVDAAVERVERHEPSGIDASQDRILIGFSLGALAAMDIAHRGNGKWDRLLLIGAEVYPNAALLKKAGVKRVLLASGERDMMRWHMHSQAESLNRRGVPAKFMTMGPVGHWFASDMDAWLNDALTWLQHDDPPLEFEVPSAARP